MKEQQREKSFFGVILVLKVIQLICYKSLSNSTWIDSILTKTPQSFQKTYVQETGMSDFHLMQWQLV